MVTDMMGDWLRVHPRIRVVVRDVAVVAVAGAVGWSSYEALSAPSRETQQIRHELQTDAGQLCAFVSGVHDLTTLFLDPRLPPPSSAIGESFLLVLKGLGQKAAGAAASPLCPAPRVTLTPTPPPPTPTGSPTR